MAASIWTWAIIVSHSWRLRREMQASAAFEQDLRQAKNIDVLHDGHATSAVPGARLVVAGIAEWRRSTGGKTIDPEGTRSRLMGAMNASAAGEIDRLSDRLNILATVGSVAPVVGLFGTVWGIMRAFTGIASANNTSLAVVAPGIAEALFATALGLFAAIPAVIAYNRLTHKGAQYAASCMISSPGVKRFHRLAQPVQIGAWHSVCRSETTQGGRFGPFILLAFARAFDGLIAGTT